jgi:hypothetical protein
MLRIPGPRRIAGAAANVFDAATADGVADLRRMPAALIDHGPQRNLYRYLAVEQATPRDAAPVLLVPPLAAPAFCFDLRRGRAARGTTWKLLDELLDADLQARHHRRAR